jgi:XRE family transcriptional regulator, regulator of sulfur utilization
MHASDKPRLNIRAIRESRGYTQEYMAEMLDICQSTYANLESGKTTLTLARLFRIADILETDFIELVEHKKTPSSKAFDASSSLHQEPQSIHPETRGLYEQLIHELKNEIDFLRSLIRTT